MGIITNLKNIFMIKDKNEKDIGNKLMRNIIILGMIGTLLLLFSNFFSKNDSTSVGLVNPPSKEKKIITNIAYEEELSRDLEEIISLIQGVGKVKVKIYAKMGSRHEYEYNQNQTNKITNEIDQNGGERQIEENNQEDKMVIVKNADGSEGPVISKEEPPIITGILIVAQGAEVSEIKYNIIKAVSSLLNLPVHKISVLPYQRR